MPCGLAGSGLLLFLRSGLENERRTLTHPVSCSRNPGIDSPHQHNSQSLARAAMVSLTAFTEDETHLSTQYSLIPM